MINLTALFMAPLILLAAMSFNKNIEPSRPDVKPADHASAVAIVDIDTS